MMKRTKHIGLGLLNCLQNRNLCLNHAVIRNNITMDNINENVIKLEYAVRGPLVIRAGEIEKELKEGGSKRLFNEVLRANIGDCHATGQKPLTFLRQVIACATDTSLFKTTRYPDDVKERVKLLLDYCGGRSVGSYSDSAGVEIIRRHCAEYIQHRDGIESNYMNIVLTTGASEGIRCVLNLINTSTTDGRPSGVMIPIPQYPLYTATLAEYGMHPINYYLDEGNLCSKLIISILILFAIREQLVFEYQRTTSSTNRIKIEMHP